MVGMQGSTTLVPRISYIYQEYHTFTQSYKSSQKVSQLLCASIYQKKKKTKTTLTSIST
jgi:hypothetical protein